MLRSLIAAAALVASTTAYPQTTTLSPTTLQVQLLAPQLLAFSGSAANFESLVAGLTGNTPVTLTTIGADGFVQIVTFVPGATFSAADAARNLELARQNLIARGIATPTAQQLAVSLMGGTLVTPTGTSALTGVVTGTTSPTRFQVRNELATTNALGVSPGLGLSGTNLQALRSALATGTPVTLTGTNPTGTTTSTTFTPTTRALTAFEVNQALQLASVTLAQVGIINPTPDQVRVALLGGNLIALNGTTVAVQGVLQGPVVNTSDTALTGTSDSPLFGTSNTPTVGTIVTTPPATAPAPAAPRNVPTLQGGPRGGGAAAAGASTGGTTPAPRR